MKGHMVKGKLSTMLGVAILAIVGICPQVFGSFDATPFFPNTSGNQWTYVKNDTIVFTRSVLPITALVNGASTMVLQDSDDGSQQNVTNDEKGICQHRDFRPNTPVEGGIKVNLLLTFTPPPCLMRATTDIGETVTSSGIARTNSLPTVGVLDLSYQASFTVQGFETITVPAGTFEVLRIEGSLIIDGNLIVSTSYFARDIGLVKETSVSNFGTETIMLISTTVSVGEIQLVTSVFPLSRAVQSGTLATAFATIGNIGEKEAFGCTIAPITSVPGASFLFAPVDPQTGMVNGLANTPVNIPAGMSQKFNITFVTSQPFAPIDVRFVFDCSNTLPAPIATGINTLLLSVSSTTVPDVVGIAVPPTVHISDTPGIFLVASLNLGASGTVSISADTGEVPLPLDVLLCEFNVLSGNCVDPPNTSVLRTMGSGEVSFYAAFVFGRGIPVPLDPAMNRVFIRFTQGSMGGGLVSVAVQVQ